MEKEIREKIEQWHGWDFCEHETLRNYCRFCKWDVPAYMRRAEMPNLERVGQLTLALDKDF